MDLANAVVRRYVSFEGVRGGSRRRFGQYVNPNRRGLASELASLRSFGKRASEQLRDDRMKPYSTPGFYNRGTVQVTCLELFFVRALRCNRYR